MDDVRLIAEALEGARQGVVFTGAGISTESGIPDFRSLKGVWSKQDPVVYQDFLNDPAERERYWRMRHSSWQEFRHAEPNAGHRAVAELERRGRIAAVITQNIDGLHQAAGSVRVLEIHGTVRRVGCIGCDRDETPEAVHARIDAGELPPRCGACGAVMKSRTVSFGENLSEEVLRDSMERASHADVFLAMGSSLVVQPAASLPLIAKEAGTFLAIINHDPTPLDDVADVVIRAGIGATLTRVVELLG